MDKEEHKKTAKYWYYISYEECVLCGRYHEYRTRMYTPKPEDPEDRHCYSQFVCGEHFL